MATYRTGFSATQRADVDGYPPTRNGAWSESPPPAYEQLLDELAAQGWTIGTVKTDRVSGTGLSDKVLALGGDDFVYGNGGNDMINGGDGNDTLYGGSGDDTIMGGVGNDTIGGDQGSDLLSGGAGTDTFRMIIDEPIPLRSFWFGYDFVAFSSKSVDTITDFDTANDALTFDYLSQNSTQWIHHAGAADNYREIVAAAGFDVNDGLPGISLLDLQTYAAWDFSMNQRAGNDRAFLFMTDGTDGYLFTNLEPEGDVVVMTTTVLEGLNSLDDFSWNDIV